MILAEIACGAAAITLFWCGPRYAFGAPLAQNDLASLKDIIGIILLLICISGIASEHIPPTRHEPISKMNGL